MEPVMNSHDADAPLTDDDLALLAALADAQEQADPMPPGMLDRIALAVSLELMNAELAVLTSDALQPARAEVDTVTFTASTISLMVTWAPSDDGVRVAGWITGGGVRVDLHTSTAVHTSTSDATGRLEWPAVQPGSVRFVIHPVRKGDRAVATPFIEIPGAS